MAVADTVVGERQSARFMYLYALAFSGGAVAYVPFLTVLLPGRVLQLSGEAALTTLVIAAFAGAISASIANICFGWASDVTRSRRRWILGGLMLSSSLLLAMPLATNATMLIAMIVVWQIGLNMMLAPLSAWAGDSVPDSQKGMLGGLLAIAPAVGALSAAFVTMDGVAAVEDREMVVMMLVVAMVVPVLLVGRPRPMPALMARPATDEPTRAHAIAARTAVARMWFARLLVQIPEASLFALLLLWFRSLDPGYGANHAASIFSVVAGVAVVLALLIGRWSDRANRPLQPLAWTAAVAAAGLLVMSAATGPRVAIAGYIAFGIASSIFLALHASQTLRVLPRSYTRGRDLGVFNLTNTVPSLIMPWLTLALVPSYGFDALFLLLAVLGGAAWLLLATMPRPPASAG